MRPARGRGGWWCSRCSPTPGRRRTSSCSSSPRGPPPRPSSTPNPSRWTRAGPTTASGRCWPPPRSGRRCRAAPPSRRRGQAPVDAFDVGEHEELFARRERGVVRREDHGTQALVGARRRRRLGGGGDARRRLVARRPARSMRSPVSRRCSRPGCWGAGSGATPPGSPAGSSGGGRWGAAPGGGWWEERPQARRWGAARWSP